MKVLIVSDARSIHTKRWVKSLSEKGIEIVLYTLYPPFDDFFDILGIRYYTYDLFTYSKNGVINKLKSFIRHFKAASDLKSVIKKEKPDILHAHYATSFGLVAAFTRFHPFILSIWGSDVYVFPKESLLNRLTLKYVLHKADKVLSTSHIMANEAYRYFSGTCEVTPFGVDTLLFDKQNQDVPHIFTIGTVKTLKAIYGIDKLIRAFALFRKRFDVNESELMIIGDGPEKEHLQKLAKSIGVSDSVRFCGAVENDRLPEYYNRIDVACFLSESESFGVSAVEAMACMCPVVTSDADGFKEVVEDGVTGMIIPDGDLVSAAEAIGKLYLFPELRIKMGIKGRMRVFKNYDWKNNVAKMISIYRKILDKYGGKS